MSALEGRRILITGAGSGIGAVTAGLAVEAGARVALLDRDGAAAEATATRLGRASALPITGDVTDRGTAGQAPDDLLGAEIVADEALPAVRAELLAVISDDASGLLATVLQSV